MKCFIGVIFLLLSLFSCKETKHNESFEDKNHTETAIEPVEQLKKNKAVFEDIISNTDINEEEKSNIELPPEIAEIEKLYQLSGIPKKEYQEQLNHPDSLKKIIDQVEKNNKKRIPKKQFPLKGELTEAQLTSKNTSTGVSIEEALLVLQNELKQNLTPEKLQKIDSISGTSLISKLNEKDVKHVIRYVNIHEGYRIRELYNKANNLHSQEEAFAFIKAIENRLEDYNKGEFKASPSYKLKLERFIKSTETTLKKMKQKEKKVQTDFKKLNPSLYFGDEVGETFFSSRVRAAVYLPLGKLSFADKVIKAVHPDLNVLNLNNVIGSPDVIEDIGAQTITGEYSLGSSGTLVVQFTDNALTNVNGPDLYIFEIGKVEPTNLEISKDGTSWIKVGKIDGGVSEVDIAEFVEPGDLFYYVKLTDLKQHSALPGADVDAIAAIGAAMRLQLDSKILFETGKSELKPEGLKAIKELTKSISVLKKGNVIVQGHTDDVGDASFNKKLSLARSKSVSSELKKLIPESSFNWIEKGLGESKPLVKNDSDENRAKNRRVEILVVPK